MVGIWVLVWNIEYHCSHFTPHVHSGSAAGLAHACASGVGVPRWAAWFGELLGLHQSWNLFAPEPNRNDGYFVVASSLRTGGHIDAHTGGELSFDPPAVPSAWYGGSHWLQYYLRVWEEAQKPQGRQCTPIYSSLIQWYCKQRADPGLQHVELVFMYKHTPPPGQNGSFEEVAIWKEDCAFDSI
mmetsp:Transcript_2477/g.5579  ORF Transcript_2477/g.5579 Transcript_2477/m.5579 type:complete len:184 (-) Transcript_2477:72-623(-)